MRLFRTIILLILVLSLAACRSATPSVPTQYAPPTDIDTYPFGLRNLTPEPPRPVGTPISSEVGTLTGVLLLDKDGQGKPLPVISTKLILAEVITTNGTPAAAGFERPTAPTTLTDAEGRFIFENLPAGKMYALVFDRISEAVMLNDPVTGGDLLFTVKGGEVVDAGRLVYQDLPATFPGTPPPGQ